MEIYLEFGNPEKPLRQCLTTTTVLYKPAQNMFKVIYTQTCNVILHITGLVVVAMEYNMD